MKTSRFAKQFRQWLGSEPEKAEKSAVIVAEMSGYSISYIRWIAGLRGRKVWPGSRRFVRRMKALGCSNRPWNERKPEELARAFVTRETLYEPSDPGRLSDIIDTCIESGS